MQLIFVVAPACAFVFTLTLLIIRLSLGDSFKVRVRMERLFSTQSNYEIKRKHRLKGKGLETSHLSFKGKALKNLAIELSMAGILLRAEEFIAIWLIFSFLPACMALLIGADWIVALALILGGVTLPYFFVGRAKAKRLELFEQQLTDALIIVGNCLRTGLTFQQAMDSIARDMPEPISKEFGRVSREVQLGLSLEQALENMVERLGSKDLMMIVAAVLIQRQVGGNLSEILDSISDTIRERLKMKASIKVLTASGRSSGMIIGLLPVFIFFILMLINPPYIKSFFETQTGVTLLCIAGGLEVVGFLAVKKVISIKF